MLKWFLNRWRKTRRPESVERWNPSLEVLSWAEGVPFTIEEGYQHILATGMTGSGKSTSLAAVAHAMLSAGYGGLVLVAKASETERWKRYAEAAGRASDLVVFAPGSGHRFDFLDFELQRPGVGAGVTENMVSVFMSVMEISGRQNSGSGGGGGRGGDPYWIEGCKRLLRALIDLLVLSLGRVSVVDLNRAAMSLPGSLDDLASETWQRGSFCFQCLRAADAKERSPEQHQTFEIVLDFACKEWPELASKTRGIILSVFTGMVDLMLRPPFRNLFCTGTTASPLDMEAGKIIVVDLAAKEFGEAGLIANVLWKTAAMRSLERREVAPGTRPVFVWMDEAQLFLTLSTDTQFLATCRSSRVAVVLATQTVSGMYGALGGGDRARVEVDALAANCGTKLFFCNDAVSNEWAANQIGKERTWHFNASTTHEPVDWAGMGFGLRGQPRSTSGCTEVIEHQCPPWVMSGLRTGGAANNWTVDAILFRSGKKHTVSDKRYLPVSFRQVI